ncbi:MAG: SagB/ThcOx family dehydrogenase [Candidatus Sericytochromatia bacterium]
MPLKSFAEFYHQETKYSPQGLSRSQRQIDWSKQPIPFKEYKKGEKIDLSKYISKKENNEDKSSETYKSLEKLSKLLYYTNGITAIVPYSPPLLLRAAPSAGGLYPTEIYIIAKDYLGLEDGIYNFQVKTHSLIKFWDKDVWNQLKESCFNNPSFEKSNLSIIFTGVFFRSSWRYEDRAYRRILLDTGHVIGNMSIYSSFIGKYCNLIGAFKDKELNELLWLDKETESALAVVNLSDDKLSNQSATLASNISFENHNTDNLLLDFHNSGYIDKYLAPKVIKVDEVSQMRMNLLFGESLEPKIINWNDKLEETILNRRSTRAYTGEAITKEQLSQILSFTYSPELYKDQGFDEAPEYFDLSLIETYIAVTDVEGLEDGCYHYSPSKKQLKQIRFKNFREELCFLCLGQDLGRDAGLVVFHTTNLKKSIDKYGERVYRYLHLDSGHLGERLNLACLRLDLGVSGIGGFFDDQVNELLGIPETEAVLYITTIGQPFKD